MHSVLICLTKMEHYYLLYLIILLLYNKIRFTVLKKENNNGTQVSIGCSTLFWKTLNKMFAMFRCHKNEPPDICPVIR